MKIRDYDFLPASAIDKRIPIHILFLVYFGIQFTHNNTIIKIY